MSGEFPGITLPVVGFSAFSGTGKTTLLKQLLPMLTQHGLRVGMVKHAHHNFDIDKPGKDSYELRKAGAAQMLVASARRWALMVDNEVENDPDLGDLLRHLDLDELDLILVEGFKHIAFTKIELHRPSLGHPLLFREDPSIIAIASDEKMDSGELPLLDINRPEEIADFINNLVKP